MDASGVSGHIRTDAAYVRSDRARYVIAICARRVRDTDWSVDNEALRTGAAISREIYDHFAARSTPREAALAPTATPRGRLPPDPIDGPIIRAVSHEAHRATSPASVRCAVITVSDTRTDATDTGGPRHRRPAAGARARRGRQARSFATSRSRCARCSNGTSPTPTSQIVITTGGTGHHLARRHLRGGVVAAREDAHRLRRAVPDAELSGDWRGGDDVAGGGGRGAGPRDHRAARLGARGAAGDDEAGAARARTSGSRSQALTKARGAGLRAHEASGFGLRASGFRLRASGFRLQAGLQAHRRLRTLGLGGRPGVASSRGSGPSP